VAFNWLKLAAGALIVSVVIALVMYYLFIIVGAPIEIRWGFFNISVSTFAAALLTFLGGVLLFDYQAEATTAEKARLLSSLLVIELSETIDALNPSNAVELKLPNDPTVVEAVIMHLQPSVVEEAVRSDFDPSGYFDRSYSEKVLRLAERMVEYNSKVSAFLSLLLQGSTAESSIKNAVLHTAQSLEELREAIVEECGLLIQHLETQKQRS
jgi:hypothetical protein